jgi:hypothetical protein
VKLTGERQAEAIPSASWALEGADTASVAAATSAAMEERETMVLMGLSFERATPIPSPHHAAREHRFAGT